MVYAIDKTANRLGHAMYIARHKTGLSFDRVAALLRISPADLKLYESATDEIPNIVLTRIIIMGYMAMNMQRANQTYKCLANHVRKYGEDYTDCVALLKSYL